MPAGVRIVKGDITTLDIEAIVNAANSTLLGGGGVDGAIHHAAGPRLLEACRRLGGCPTGEARITPGFGLKARWVVHTVGPVWKGGNRGEAKLLAACYENSLQLAAERRLTSIAFPAISSGAYGYPLKPAAEIAIASVKEFVKRNEVFEVILFCCYSREAFATYQGLLPSAEREDPASDKFRA
jgi:O-acetyl-ADP-ribose deacetylase